jgi:hypothetical protein
MNVEQASLVFHPEQDNYLGVGAVGTKPGEIPVAFEDDPVETSLEVPRMPFLDTAVAIGLRIRHGRPGISGSA